MNRTWGILVVTIALVTAGCMQTQDGGDGTPASVNPTVTLTAPADGVQVTAGEAFTVEWDVEPEPSGDHDIPHTGVHWADFSVDAGATTGPGAYGNTSGATDATIPDSFSTQVTIDEPGTIYLRAHAIADDKTNYWSAEITIEVQAASDGGGGAGGSQGTTHTVKIGTQSSCLTANYDPSSITISVGDSVQWENEDSCAHTATPQGMQGTGNIDPGATSDPVVFDQAGTYGISCDYHGQMSGEVVVEA